MQVFVALFGYILVNERPYEWPASGVEHSDFRSALGLSLACPTTNAAFLQLLLACLQSTV